MVGFNKMASTSVAHNSEMRNELLQLMTDKSKIEAVLQQCFDVLSTNNIGMHEPLVDREGFPRNDIDVYLVRTTRHKIICLQNDHKNLMLKIEKGLHKLHASSGTDPSAESCSSEDQQLPEPFACVTLVSPGSPADICGLQTGDLLLEFGSVNKSNFKSMQDVAGVVRHSAGQRVSVMVQRRGRNSPLYLDLMPQNWSGQGLIGCKIDPLPIISVER